MESAQEPRTLEEIRQSWISGHIYYHESLDRAVRGWVHPLVATLVKAGRLDAFFFIRHGLGGPHVRLRLRAAAGAEDQVRDAMQQLARTFLARKPSTRPLDEEAIRRANAYILEADRHEIDDSVYPDNSFHLVPFRPEIQRYGGPGRFRISLDYFTLSSVAALDFLSRHGDAPRPAQLAQAFALLLRQALGFARDREELADLLRYGVDSWGRELQKIVDKGDKVARSQMELFLQIFFRSLKEVRRVRTHARPPGRPPVTDLSPVDLLAAGAGGLSAAIGADDRPTRARIGGSQLHMTASRLGLTNAEEVYLSRLLTLTLGQACDEGGANLSWLGETVAERDPAEAVSSLLSPALAALPGPPTHQDTRQPSA